MDDFRLPTDEGFLDWGWRTTADDDDLLLLGRGENNDGEVDVERDFDVNSLLSDDDGAEILQLVDQLLLDFNMEVQAAAAAAATAAATEETTLVMTESATESPIAWEEETDNLERAGSCCSDFADNEASSSSASSAFSAASETSSFAVTYPMTSSSSSITSSEYAITSSQQPMTSPPLMTSSTETPPPAQPPRGPYLATGLFRLPQEVVLEAMDYWGPLDRVRWLLWRSEPCPPQQQRLQQPPPPPPQQPLDKSKRACSFLLKGRCRKEDCEFAHDLSRVTCKFWSSGQCFKGAACPFLHGFVS